MDAVEITLIITAAVGLFMMTVTVVRLRMDDEKGSGDSYLESGNSIKAINQSLDEAEKTISELNAFAESVMKDINAKQQELMFVYNLIEEKKGEVSSSYGRQTAGTQAAPPAQSRAERKREEELIPQERKKAKPQREATRRDIHPRSKEIMGMYDSGASIAEISKKLDMGQGEVKLIVELTKAR